MKYSSRFVQFEAYFSCQSPNVWVTGTGESLSLMGGIIRHMQTSKRLQKDYICQESSKLTFDFDDVILLAQIR